MLERITAMIFSPTGGTRRAALCLAEHLATQVCEVDLFMPGEHRLNGEDVVIVAVPVFGGRIPASAAARLKKCVGNGARAVTLAVYGNRAYDDALLELNDYVEAQGFRVVASAALIAEHSMSRTVAAGRPDVKDCEEMQGYAKAILHKLKSGEQLSTTVPGNRPYRDWKPMPAVPLVSDACVSCGLCAEKCPVQAIPKDAPQTTDPAKCILCMRCVSLCPEQARRLPDQVQGMLDQKLAPLQQVRRENEWFL